MPSYGPFPPVFPLSCNQHAEASSQRFFSASLMGSKWSRTSCLSSVHHYLCTLFPMRVVVSPSTVCHHSVCPEEDNRNTKSRIPVPESFFAIDFSFVIVSKKFCWVTETALAFLNCFSVYLGRKSLLNAVTTKFKNSALFKCLLWWILKWIVCSMISSFEFPAHASSLMKTPTTIFRRLNTEQSFELDALYDN